MVFLWWDRGHRQWAVVDQQGEVTLLDDVKSTAPWRGRNRNRGDYAPGAPEGWLEVDGELRMTADGVGEIV